MAATVTTVTVGDVARVAAGAAPPIGKATIVGEAGVVMMVIGQFGADTLAVSREIDAALAELAPTFERRGVVLHDDLFRPATYIQRSLAGIAEHLAVGAALVVAILVAFLFNARTAFISAFAIPLSLIAASVVLLEVGANINIMVLGGLAIALGEVVDDANHRHRERVPPPARKRRPRGAAPDPRRGVRRLDGSPRLGGPPPVSSSRSPSCHCCRCRASQGACSCRWASHTSSPSPLR